jgi:hypothetical protein
VDCEGLLLRHYFEGDLDMSMVVPAGLLIHPRIARRFHRAQTTNSEIPPRALRTDICCESGIIASADRRRQRTNVAQSRDGRRHFCQGDQNRKLGSWTDILPLECVQRRGGISRVGKCVGKGDVADRDERDAEAITFASSLGRLPKRDVPRSRFTGKLFADRTFSMARARQNSAARLR